MNNIHFAAVGDVNCDGCTSYTLQFERMTFRDFLESVLREFPDDWGCICLAEPGLGWTSSPYVEYYKGRLVDEMRQPLVGYGTLTDEELSREVMTGVANGRWSRMNYHVW